eukprot:m.64408 g.64408  ORF g.64408 m.64408 type:complete len:85 (+) comp12014_c0_seq1:1078-1332(+)
MHRPLSIQLTMGATVSTAVCLLSMKVYYNETVPDGFSIDDFAEDVSESDAFQIPKESRIKLDCGGTATHHDALKVYVQTNQDQV